jgi:hypothetical protein
VSELLVTVRRSSVLRRVLAPLRVAYHVILGEPMEEGRLSLRGLDTLTRQVAVAGLVALGGLFVSILAVEHWRHGTLVDVGTIDDPAFLPKVLVPVTLVALFVAWVAILWGALDATWWIRLLVAAMFLVLNASLSKPAVVALNSSFALKGTPDLALWTYAAAAGVVVLVPEAGRLARVRRWVKPVAGGAVVVTVGLFFGAALWAMTGQIDSGLPVTIPTQLSGAVLEIQNLLIPMVLVSVAAIVVLSYSISEAVTAPFWRLNPLVVKATLAGLLALKIWREVGVNAHDWWLYIEQRPGAVARTLIGLVLLAGLGVLARYLRPDARASEHAKEAVAYTTAFVLALPLLVFMLVTAIEEFLVIVLSATDQAAWIRTHFPDNWVSASSPAFWAPVIAVAILLLVRQTSGAVREGALGLLLMGIWAEYFLIPQAFGYEPGFNVKLLDAALTLAIAAYLVIGWRWISGRRAVWLGAVVALAWLVGARGEWVHLIGRFFGLPLTIILVAGLVYALLTDAEFTRESSARFPSSARTLMWLGYLVLSATIVNWVLAIHHENPIEGPTLKGFAFLGLPLAVWLLSWRPFDRAEEFEADEAA